MAAMSSSVMEDEPIYKGIVVQYLNWLDVIKNNKNVPVCMRSHDTRWISADMTGEQWSGLCCECCLHWTIPRNLKMSVHRLFS